jgi:hypothetical protein
VSESEKGQARCAQSPLPFETVIEADCLLVPRAKGLCIWQGGNVGLSAGSERSGKGVGGGGGKGGSTSGSNNDYERIWVSDIRWLPCCGRVDHLLTPKYR